MLVTDFVSELAVSLAKQNERAEALAHIDGSIATQLRSKRPLHLPALFWARGMALVHGKVRQISSAQECFEEAMMLAGQQSALSFELRSGLALARLWINRGQIRKAHDLIAPIYNQFTEGLATPDLILEKRMLEQTSAPTRRAGRGAG
jgi:hypothetical protein